jgi:uncharacterized lipoprotein YddW (UPF0748 family)
VLQQTNAPDHGHIDILEMVLTKTKKRGMKVFAWIVDTFRRDIPNIDRLQESNLQGQKAATCCAYNPDYRNFVLGLTRDLCSSYELDGLMWGSEHQGPLHNLITNFGYSKAGTTACFCDFHRKAAQERGIVKW